MNRIETPGPSGASGGLRRERILEGLGVSPGFALGIAWLPGATSTPVPEQRIDPDRLDHEVDRFERAVEASRQQLETLKQKSRALPNTAADEVGFLVDAHLAMLSKSRLLRGVSGRIAREGINAEAAIRHELDAIAGAFALMDDPYLASRFEDIRIVAARITRNLADAPVPALSALPPGTVVLAEELSPAETAMMDPSRVIAFATVLGGAESHTAIVARALGIPAVLGCFELLDAVSPGDRILVDGSAGTVTINPAPETLALVEARRVLVAREQRELSRLRNLPSVTRDGVEITLEANLNSEHPRELAHALEEGASGVGLVRTEFLFMNREQQPTEDEQAEALTAIVKGMGGRPVTIRTLDIGGDKNAESLRALVGEAVNPALGLRAIRLTLKHPAMLETHFRAILRAGVHGPIRVLLPMISNRQEIIEARAVLQRVYHDMQVAGIPVPPKLPPLGIMIEVPGAALAADALAAMSDFFSIGTNDLTQYTLAIDRSDEQVAHLYNPLHPAVLRLIQFTAEAARHAGIPVGLCGEVAGDPRFTPLLIGLGIRSLSMAPPSLMRVKQRVRRLTLSTAQAFAAAVMREPDERHIAAMLDQPPV
jgi:phosphotransferase system enzyme I (PtsI)